MNSYTAYMPWWDKKQLASVTLTPLEFVPSLVQKSKKAFTYRSTSDIKERISCIKKFVDVYAEKKQYFAELISKEMGKPITQAYGDIDFDIWYIRYYLDNAADILAPERIFEDELWVHTAYFEARWVWASISPRNFPTSQFVRQVIPPLLAWNTLLYKPAHPCVVVGKEISELLSACLPPDVLISVLGWGDLGEALIQDNIDFVVFTWSAATGKKVNSSAALGLKKTFLELGGSAPGIILPDAAIDGAMMETMSWFRRRHGGQICDGLKRLFVHKSRYDECITACIAYLENKKVGNPLDPDTDLWCIVNETQYQLLQEQLADAKQKWAQIVELGIYDNTPGPFMKHTIVLDATTEMRVMQEEVFWPVLPIVAYETLDEALEQANGTPYGLWWYVWGNDPELLTYVTHRLKTGNINVNNTNYVIPQVPFWGYKKDSGNCREHGIMWLREYCEVKVVSTPK